jgi:two-component system OmpR family sensor kinase
MVATISHLDRFTKDLIHDLNTPITSILLNTKMLERNIVNKDMKKVSRIENSAKDILALYNNLEILLDKHNLTKEQINIQELLISIVDSYKQIYPKIRFHLKFEQKYIYSNYNALKRILDNIISNASKYSIDTTPEIFISYKNNVLTIKDNGKGMKYPKKIFERSYKEMDNGHGIGMHIVHRLCSELSLKITIESTKNIGTTVILG